MSSGKYDTLREAELAYTNADTDALVDTKSSNKTITWIIIIGVLAVLLVAVTAALIGVSIAVGITSNSGNDVCFTEGCVQVSAQISAAMNQSVDPCDDFYQFACGNWLKTTGIPPQFNLYSYFQTVPFEATNTALGKIFEDDDDGGVAGVRKAIDYYKSCKDIDTINSRGAEPLRELIRATGGWSLVGITETEPWTLNSTSFQNEKLYGSDAFFRYGFEIDPYNSSIYNLVLTESGVDVAGFNNPTALKELIVGMLSLISPPPDNSAYESVADAIIALEHTNIGPSFEPIGNVTQAYNIFTVNQFQSEVFPQRIHVKTPNYFRNLSRMYQASTDTSVLQHYAKWRLIKGYAPYLSSDFLQLFNTFNQATNPGAPSSTDRTLPCILSVQNGFPVALSRLFTERVLHSGTKETLSMTTEMIRDAFRDRLQTNPWLDEFSRQQCIDKTDAIVKMVAYPDQLFDNNYVNGFYDSLTISPTDYLGNYMRILELTARTNVRRFFSGVNRLEWPVDIAKPTDVNAFYSPYINEIIILEGILAPPVFNAKWPDYINFGAIGSIIGHEISHGFDNTGQLYDKNGILRQWWSNEGISEFNSRLPCFVNQYNGYTIEGYQVNGQRTLGENIADLGGLNTAFRAHRNRLKQGGVTQTLPSLDYNVDQLFFIAYSQLWCTLYTPSGAQRLLTTDSHSPGQARVLGHIRKFSPDFAEVFNCPAGSKMNPPTSDKCELW